MPPPLPICTGRVQLQIEHMWDGTCAARPLADAAGTPARIWDPPSNRDSWCPLSVTLSRALVSAGGAWVAQHCVRTTTSLLLCAVFVNRRPVAKQRGRQSDLCDYVDPHTITVPSLLLDILQQLDAVMWPVQDACCRVHFMWVQDAHLD